MIEHTLQFRIEIRISSKFTTLMFLLCFTRFYSPIHFNGRRITLIFIRLDILLDSARLTLATRKLRIQYTVIIIAQHLSSLRESRTTNDWGEKALFRFPIVKRQFHEQINSLLF